MDGNKDEQNFNKMKPFLCMITSYFHSLVSVNYDSHLETTLKRHSRLALCICELHEYFLMFF